jgi:hypothetical protein
LAITNIKYMYREIILLRIILSIDFFCGKALLFCKKLHFEKTWFSQEKKTLPLLGNFFKKIWRKLRHFCKVIPY